MFAFALLTGAFMSGGPAQGKVRVLGVSPDSPAAASGLKPDDVVIGVAGEPVGSATSLRQTIEAHIGDQLALRVLRGKEELNLFVEPRADYPQGEGPAGFTTVMEVEPYTVPAALQNAARQEWIILHDSVLTLWQVVAGHGEGFRVIGPVGLKQASDWTIEQSQQWSALYPLLYLAGLINIGLGFTNLLPVPALDGGRMVFVLYEVVTRRSFPFRIERLIQAAGAIGIVLAMIVLSIMDVRHPLF
jgi:regulator of sigma E protease